MEKFYYAIKIGNNVENIVVENWEECKSYVLNYNSVYKGFKTLKEANKWLSSLTDEDVNEILERQYKMKLKREIRELEVKQIARKVEKEFILDHLYDVVNTLINDNKIKFQFYDKDIPLELAQVCYNKCDNRVELSFYNIAKQYVDELKEIIKKNNKDI